MQARPQLLTTPLEAFAWTHIVGPLAAAEDAIARLDERLAKSPIRDGWVARTHFTDACASLWLDGTLVHIDDLVFHDAGMNLRTPTHELTQAHTVLQSRRQIAAAEPDWAFTLSGLDRLRGKRGEAPDDQIPQSSDDHFVRPEDEDNEEISGNAVLDEAFKALDAAIDRAKLRLTGGQIRQAIERDPLIHDPDWDEDARLTEWRRALDKTRDFPPVLASALALASWDAIEPLQHMPWLGRLLAAAQLRSRGKTRSHFACLNVGLRAIPRERRRARDETTRLVSIIDALAAGAEAGLKDHDRWLGVRIQLQRKLEGRRSTSKLPVLIDYMMGCPIASAAMIADELGITPRAAQDLVNALGLREATGRDRYRAWGIL